MAGQTEQAARTDISPLRSWIAGDHSGAASRISLQHRLGGAPRHRPKLLRPRGIVNRCRSNLSSRGDDGAPEGSTFGSLEPETASSGDGDDRRS
jgi:hypothetical protein